MVTAYSAAPRFEMGRVVKRTFGVIGSNIAAFVVLSVVPGLAWAVAGLAGNQFEVDLAASTFPESSTILLFVIAGLIYLATGVVLQAGVVHGAVISLSGRRVSIADCLATGLKYVLPLFLIGLLATLGVVAGLMLLIVPGVMLAVMWVAVAPACVVEHTGVFGAFSRSRELTRGYRWPIFGLYILFFILMFIITFVVGLLIGLATGASMIAVSPEVAAAGMTDTSMMELATSAVSTMLMSIITSALAASVYYELRQIKEGIGPEALASVFD